MWTRIVVIAVVLAVYVLARVVMSGSVGRLDLETSRQTAGATTSGAVPGIDGAPRAVTDALAPTERALLGDVRHHALLGTHEHLGGRQVERKPDPGPKRSEHGSPWGVDEGARAQGGRRTASRVDISPRRRRRPETCRREPFPGPAQP